MNSTLLKKDYEETENPFSDSVIRRSENILVTDKFADRYKKFKELQRKCNKIKEASAKRRFETEQRRSRKLIKKALKDPLVKELVEKNEVPSNSKSAAEEDAERSETLEWKDVKTFLSINDHLTNLNHSCRPKTELESLIEDAIKDGDFEKAELLSDTLADRQFAVKITQAFAAKRYHNKLVQQKAAEKLKRMQKIRWMFDAKERWQMKGNM